MPKEFYNLTRLIDFCLLTRAAEVRKHPQSDSKCAEISWKYILLAVSRVFWCMGSRGFKGLITRLAIRGNTSKSMALTDLFGRLSHSLLRANAGAILSRSYSHLVQQVDELCVVIYNTHSTNCMYSCLYTVITTFCFTCIVMLRVSAVITVVYDFRTKLARL